MATVAIMAKIIGFGSLLSEKSARSTFGTSLSNFRLARVRNYRRLFTHPASIFFERGIANLSTKEISSLSTEPAEGCVFTVSVFEIPDDMLPAFYEREEEFKIASVPFEEVDGSPGGEALMCTRWSDEAYIAAKSVAEFERMYKSHGLDTIWGWDENSGILPCRIYLRHCVLSVQKLGEKIYEDFVTTTFLGDRKTTIKHVVERDDTSPRTAPRSTKRTAREMQLIKQVKAFGGLIKQFSHESATTKCTMKFSIFLPPTASETNRVPVLFYLAGLTCNDELLFVKAPIAQKTAAARGIAIVTPDTSEKEQNGYDAPRNVNIEGEDDSWDFGSAAGFYVDATEPKWDEHYRMYSYVTKELPSLITQNFPVLEDKFSIMGHSMGGHGALVLGLRNPDIYKSISAFAPISHPSQCPWGIKAFTGYLGCEQEAWKEYDATHLMLKNGPVPKDILIDQGTEDQFLNEKQLLPEAFEEGYDHSYYFISTFIEDHINHHANALLA
ncbi:TPA: hypothetical protein N0F65_008143 [Lagenidium giganteum]|uniref:S-formylglutathione hydrolase n=1 Tax=Lagenidium giganteum TaxID=4803 RepID=A0AAV2YFB1_9STRA|nr:TPA: hypothetical protein N0F65_008143 [Lagenidium giganteum]